MKKYTALLLMLLMPAVMAQPTTVEELADLIAKRQKISRILADTVQELRFQDLYIDYPRTWLIPPPKVEIYSEREYANAFCDRDNIVDDEIMIQCVEAEVTEAFYSKGEGIFYFRDDIDLTTSYGVGTVMHEAVHLYQDRRGLLDLKCPIWAEYEAVRLEEKLLEKFGHWISPEDKAYYARWRNMYVVYLNKEKTDCKD
jgi:hypothetical protein